MIRPIGHRAMVAFIVGALFAVHGHAAEINGAWVTNSKDCGKIFVKRHDRISFTKNSDIRGSGFIIDGKELRGKLAKCQIKSRKDDGPMVHILATCSTDVAFLTSEFNLRVEDDNKLTRVFQDTPEMNVMYFRCLL